MCAKCRAFNITRERGCIFPIEISETLQSTTYYIPTRVQLIAPSPHKLYERRRSADFYSRAKFGRQIMSIPYSTYEVTLLRRVHFNIKSAQWRGHHGSHTFFRLIAARWYTAKRVRERYENIRRLRVILIRYVHIQISYSFLRQIKKRTRNTVL